MDPITSLLDQVLIDLQQVNKMRNQMQQPLLRRPTRGRRSLANSFVSQQENIQNRQQYIPPNPSPGLIQQRSGSVDTSSLQWEASSEDAALIQARRVQRPSLKLKYWNDELAENKEKTLNDKVFNLNKKIQAKLYWFNMIMNFLMRVAFINLLVFLALQDKRIYLYLFLSLELLAILLYFIVMIKMLFTRSDRESVYFQKIFKESDWADIEAERMMRSHFQLGKILGKIKTFFNPFTKFKGDTKISFLRQQIFKRMQLVLVIIPFTTMFLIKKSDFVTPNYPDFGLWITSAIVLQVLRTIITYITVFIFN